MNIRYPIYEGVYRILTFDGISRRFEAQHRRFERLPDFGG